MPRDIFVENPLIREIQEWHWLQEFCVFPIVIASDECLKNLKDYQEI